MGEARRRGPLRKEERLLKKKRRLEVVRRAAYERQREIAEARRVANLTPKQRAAERRTKRMAVTLATVAMAYVGI